jgi:hypothetical protein
VAGVRISVERRGGKRFLLAYARVNQPATAHLRLVRGKRVPASARKPWTTGANTIRAAVPRGLSGRMTAELRVGTQRFKRLIRFG